MIKWITGVSNINIIQISEKNTFIFKSRFPLICISPHKFVYVIETYRFLYVFGREKAIRLAVSPGYFFSEASNAPSTR